MLMTNPEEKPLAWLGSSKKDLMALPMGIRKFFGHAWTLPSEESGTM